MNERISFSETALPAILNLDFFQNLLENSNDIIYAHGLDGRFTFLNQAGEVVFGYTQTEILKTGMSELMTGDFRALMQMLLESSEKDIRKTVEIEILAKNGRKVPLEVNLNLLIQAGRPFQVQGIARDLRERKSLEEQLRQSQRMEAIGKLAGGIAHDFNNVLTIIQGYTDLLLIRLEGNEMLQKQAEEIHKASERAAGLIRQLLAFSRKQVYQLRIVNFNTVIENINKMLQQLIGEDIELETRLDTDLEGVEADSSQLEQVLLNLINNARDAMPQGGKIVIETRNIVLDLSYVRQHKGAKPGRYVLLVVSDTGCGMDQETQSRIFEPFFTTKDPEKGTGLGLSNVYGFVNQCGGFIWIYSELNVGTTFKVYLPSAQMPSSCDESPGTEPVGGTETILVAEDDPGVRSLIYEMLRSLGYAVLEAQTPFEALALASRFDERIHLLITDIVMPKMSGSELAWRLHLARPEVKILLMSGYTTNTITDYAVRDIGSTFLEKPFTLPSLAKKVRQVLDSLA